MLFNLCHFEGNVQAIRMVRSLLKLNLIYAQVGCILKYTRSALAGGAGSVQLSHEETGLLSRGRRVFPNAAARIIAREFHRFLLMYIMEAADDISYCIADLEDAVEKKIFTVEQLYLFLQKEWGSVVKGDLFDKVIGQAFNDIRRYQGLRSGDSVLWRG